MGLLEQIIADKRREIEEQKRLVPLSELRRRAAEALPPRDFYTAVSRPGIIAEIKPRSPSAGFFRRDFDALGRAASYQKAGAAALSVLTDEKHFGGSLELLTRIKELTAAPCLAKDFVLDEYQLYAARAAGADAFLLIVRLLPADSLRRLYETGAALGMTCLCEIHEERELEAALACGARFIGINNRDLATFRTDLTVSERLARRAPSGCRTAALSGISSSADILRLRRAGLEVFLIGGALSRSDDPEELLQELLSALHKELEA